MVAYAKERVEERDYKKLNLPLDNKLHGQPREIRKDGEKRGRFVYGLLTEVFNAKDTALWASSHPQAGSYDLGPNPPGSKIPRSGQRI